MLFSVAYLVVRRLLSCLIVLARSEVSNDAEQVLGGLINEYRRAAKRHVRRPRTSFGTAHASSWTS
jgi:hypothetical protein